MKFIVGIDPSSGARSGIALSVINIETNTVVYFSDYKPPANTELQKRLKYIFKYIITQFKHILENIIKNDKAAVAIEHTVMQGRGGESLVKAVGVIMAACPATLPLHEISNMQMKVIAGGSGKADKKDIGKNLQLLLPNSKETLFNLTASSRWDIIDSIGLGVACYEKIYKSPEVKRDSDQQTVKKSRFKRKTIRL